MPEKSEFPNAPDRSDPYRNFRFLVKWDGTYVAGVSKASGLTKSALVAKHPSGGDVPGPMPGQPENEAITLERGITYDPGFAEWANKVWYYPSPTNNEASKGDRHEDGSIRGFRKDIILEFYNVAGQKVLAYNIYRCWVSEFIAMPELDALGNAVVIQSITLENEGWERAGSIHAPPEPSFKPPSG